MATYVNNLRLKEIATGAESGTWGTSTNTNLELIADAFGSGTEAITTNADTHTTTVADGAADEGRAIYMKYTGTLDSACTITLAPNTINKFWIIENATSGSQNIIISQGSGANITIGNGNVSAVFTDGAGGGAAVLDALADLELSAKLIVAGNVDFNGDLDVDGTTNLDAVDIDGAVQVDSTITVGVDDTGYDVKFFGDTASAYMLWDTSTDDLVLAGAAGIDLAGDLDVDGTTNLDVVDIDGAVDMASTLTLGSTLTVNAGAVFNEASADVDFRVESNGNANMLFVDGGNNKVGLGTATPNTILTLYGSTATGGIYINSGSDEDHTIIDMSGQSNGGKLIWDHSELAFSVNKSFQLTGASSNLTVAGDLAVGTTLRSDLHSAWSHIFLGEKGSLYSDNDAGAGGIDGMFLTDNLYLDSDTGAFAYIETNEASYIKQEAGVLTFANAASGTGGAGATLTTRLTVNAAGDVILPATGKLYLDGGSNTYINEPGADQIDFFTGGGERLKITSSQFQIGTAANIAGLLTVAKTGSSSNWGAVFTNNYDSSSDVSVSLAFANSSGRNSGIAVAMDDANAGEYLINLTSASTERFEVAGDGAVTMSGTLSCGAITATGATHTLFQATNSGNPELKFGSSAAECLRIQPVYDGSAQTLNYIAIDSVCASGTANKGEFRFTVDGDASGTSTFKIQDAGVDIAGALSKGSGSFKIDHPLPAKKDTHHLVHSFVEGPRADLIYRGVVTLSGGAATVDIDAAAGMTAGTFELLCRDVQCFTANETDWTAVRGSVSGSVLTIEAEDASCTAAISWMVVGERKDPHMVSTNWTDDDGRVIVEPEKEDV